MKTVTNTPLDITLLRRLVALPSVSGDVSSNNKALEFISSYLIERGMHITRSEHDGYGALVATTHSTKTPTVMLVAHVDVVAAPEQLFELCQTNGKLSGRGVWDMKFAIASYMATVDALALRGQLKNFDFGVMITTDEETQDLGVKYLLEEGFVPQVAIIPDGSNDWQIESAAKGALYIDIAITGKTAHGSRPWLGDSASFKAVALLSEIKAWFSQKPEGNTLNISAIETGKMHKGHNRIPDRASIALDIRVINDVECDHIKQQLTKLCAKYDATYNVGVFFPPLQHDATNRFIVQFAASINRVANIENRGFLSFGASDAAHFHAYNVPCIVTSPAGGDRHSDDEWMDEESFLQLTPILLDYLSTIAKIDA